MEASVNNPQHRGQRISNGSKFPADKNRIAAASTTHIARKKAMHRLTHADLTPKAFVS